MFSHSRRPPLTLIVGILLFLASLAPGQEVLNTLPIESTLSPDIPIPPRPSEPVLDNAHFLGSEALKNLNDTLSAAARDHGVHVFVLIVPSLPKNNLAPFTKRVTQEWTKGLFGAVLVFDDGTGVLAIEKSEEFSKRFYEFELTTLIKEGTKVGKRPRLSREGLQYTARTVADSLRDLKARADREDRNALYTRMGVALFLIVTIALLAIPYFRRPPATGTAGETEHPDGS